MRLCRMWNEKGRRIQSKITGECSCTKKRQKSSFKQLDMRDCFATTRQNGTQRLQEDQPVDMRILYRCIQIFWLFSKCLRLELSWLQRLNWCRKRQHWKVERQNVAFRNELQTCPGIHDDLRRVTCWRGATLIIGFADGRLVHKTVGFMVLGNCNQR